MEISQEVHRQLPIDKLVKYYLPNIVRLCTETLPLPCYLTNFQFKSQKVKAYKNNKEMNTFRDIHIVSW